MASLSRKYIILNPKFLPYFLPRKLKKDNIFPMTTLSLKKKNIEFEVTGFNILDVQQSVDFLSCLENRFCLYEKSPLFSKQEFSMCFQSVDLATETFSFSKKRKKMKFYDGILPFLIEKNNLLERWRHNVLVKARLLRVTRGGFLASFLGNSAFVLRSSFFYKFSKRKSYQNWFYLNIKYYGFLTYFCFIDLKRIISPYVKVYQRRFVSERSKFYYLQNKVGKYFFLLARPKHF